MDDDGDGRLRDSGPDDHGSFRGRLLRYQDESFDELVTDLMADVIEGLELLLSFEAWWTDAQE